MNLDYEKFGKFVSERRKNISTIKTSTRLAQLLNISATHVLNIENGKRGFTFELFVDLADALQMTPGELMMVLAGRQSEQSLMVNPLDKITLDRFIEVAREYIEESSKPFIPHHPPQPYQLLPITPELQATIDEMDAEADRITGRVKPVNNHNKQNPPHG